MKLLCASLGMGACAFLHLMGAPWPNVDISLSTPPSPAGAPRPFFEPNRGQVDRAVHHIARTHGGLIYLSGNSLVLHRTGTEDTVRCEFTGAATAAGVWREAEPTGTKVSYMVGRDQSQWASDVPHFARLERTGLYPGIDLAYYSDAEGNLEYDLRLQPQADPAAIRLHVEGAARLEIEASGALAIHPASGAAAIRHRPPYAYQTRDEGSRQPIEARFVLHTGQQAGFELGAYDPTRPVMIDPVIEASSYLGGSGDDKVTSAGSGWAVGTTASIDFPGQTGRRFGRDVFYRSGESTLILGGSGDEDAATVNADGGGYIFALAGVTNSPDLPTNLVRIAGESLPVDWQPNMGGGATDGFIFVLGSNSGAVKPTFASYVGGPGDDRITATRVNAFASPPIAAVGVTTGRGLAPTSFKPVIIGPGGGTADGFFMTLSARQVTSLAYFGGSGDDTA